MARRLMQRCSAVILLLPLLTFGLGSVAEAQPTEYEFTSGDLTGTFTYDPTSDSFITWSFSSAYGVDYWGTQWPLGIILDTSNTTRSPGSPTAGLVLMPSVACTATTTQICYSDGGLQVDIQAGSYSWSANWCKKASGFEQFGCGINANNRI